MSHLHPQARALTWLLRHGPQVSGLDMDAAGFVEVGAVLAHLRIRADELDIIIAADGKSRFELRSGRVRAAQGHSSDNGRVTQAALEASWALWEGATTLWHGTSVEAARTIAGAGIAPMARTHVHLALAPASRVGKRAGVDLLLGVSPQRLRAEGRAIWLSPNGVALVRQVPAACITGLIPLSRAAKATDWAPWSVIIDPG